MRNKNKEMYVKLCAACREELKHSKECVEKSEMTYFKYPDKRSEISIGNAVKTYEKYFYDNLFFMAILEFDDAENVDIQTIKSLMKTNEPLQVIKELFGERPFETTQQFITTLLSGDDLSGYCDCKTISKFIKKRGDAVGNN